MQDPLSKRLDVRDHVPEIRVRFETSPVPSSVDPHDVPSVNDVPSFIDIPCSVPPTGVPSLDNIPCSAPQTENIPYISSPITSTLKGPRTSLSKFPRELSPVPSGIEIPSDQETSYSRDIRYSLEVWVPADKQKLFVNLNVNDRNILNSKDWLNDTIIDASLSLLRYQFPDLHGLQSCSHAGTQTFERHSDLFIQIIQIINRTPTGPGSHWITISNLKAADLTKDVVVYDSAFVNIPHEESLVIASLVNIQSNIMNVHFANIQMQKNSHDCGLFAIANATALANCFIIFSIQCLIQMIFSRSHPARFDFKNNT